MGETLVSKALDLEGKIGEHVNVARRIIAICTALEAYKAVFEYSNDDDTRDWADQKMSILNRWLSLDQAYRIKTDTEPAYMVVDGKKTLLTIKNIDKIVEAYSAAD